MFKKVRAALGFDRCEFFLSAAAPLMRETCEFFMSLDIPITEAFGMSECSGIIAALKHFLYENDCNS